MTGNRDINNRSKVETHCETIMIPSIIIWNGTEAYPKISEEELKIW